MLIKSFARVATVALVAMTIVVAPVGQTAKAQTATGATAFTINFPEVIVLHYWSQLDMTLAADQVTQYLLTQADGEDDLGTTTGVVISGGSTFSANVSASFWVGSNSATTTWCRRRNSSAIRR